MSSHHGITDSFDPISTFLLREFIDLLLPYLTSMVNASLAQERFNMTGSMEVDWYHDLSPWLTLNRPRSRSHVFSFKYLEYGEFARKVRISICLDFGLILNIHSFSHRTHFLLVLEICRDHNHLGPLKKEVKCGSLYHVPVAPIG